MMELFPIRLFQASGMLFSFSGTFSWSGMLFSEVHRTLCEDGSNLYAKGTYHNSHEEWQMCHLHIASSSLCHTSCSCHPLRLQSSCVFRTASLVHSFISLHSRLALLRAHHKPPTAQKPRTSLVDSPTHPFTIIVLHSVNHSFSSPKSTRFVR